MKGPLRQKMFPEGSRLLEDLALLHQGRRPGVTLRSCPQLWCAVLTAYAVLVQQSLDAARPLPFLTLTSLLAPEEVGCRYLTKQIITDLVRSYPRGLTPMVGVTRFARAVG
jgi:hypothetical protein